MGLISRVSSRTYRGGQKNMTTQLRKFDDELMDKEMLYRNLVEKTYNQQLEDFDNEGEYNNYLEQKEDMIYDMTVCGPERLMQRRKEIDAYQKQNELQIRNTRNT